MTVTSGSTDNSVASEKRSVVVKAVTALMAESVKKGPRYCACQTKCASFLDFASMTVW